MTLMVTNDGMFGWKIKGEVKWFTSQYKARIYGLINMDFEVDDPKEVAEYNKEFDLALQTLSQYQHTRAEFGVLGTFMYTTAEEE